MCVYDVQSRGEGVRLAAQRINMWNGRCKSREEHNGCFKIQNRNTTVGLHSAPSGGQNARINVKMARAAAR